MGNVQGRNRPEQPCMGQSSLRYKIHSLIIQPNIFNNYAYSDKVLDHFTHPRNVGTLDKDKKNVGTAWLERLKCGDVMRLQIEVDEATGIIQDAKFKTFGCG